MIFLCGNGNEKNNQPTQGRQFSKSVPIKKMIMSKKWWKLRNFEHCRFIIGALFLKIWINFNFQEPASATPETKKFDTPAAATLEATAAPPAKSPFQTASTVLTQWTANEDSTKTPAGGASTNQTPPQRPGGTSQNNVTVVPGQDGVDNEGVSLVSYFWT